MIIPKRLLKSEKIPLLPFPFGRSIKCSWNPIQSKARSLLNYGKCKEKQPLWELFAFFVTSLYSLDGASVPRKNFQYYAKPAVSPCCLMFTPYQNLLFFTLLDTTLDWLEFWLAHLHRSFQKERNLQLRFLQGVVTTSTPKNDFIHVLHKLKRAHSSPFFSLNAFFFQEKK